MPLEDGVVLGNLRLDLNGLLVDVEVENAVDQNEIFKLHDGRLGARALGGDQFVDARAEVFQDKIFSVVALPSLTSCVHFPAAA